MSTRAFAVKRPGTGIPAFRLKEFLGKRATRGLPPDHLLEPCEVGNSKSR